jgi:rod shape-determining protein MreB
MPHALPVVAIDPGASRLRVLRAGTGAGVALDIASRVLTTPDGQVWIGDGPRQASHPDHEPVEPLALDEPDWPSVTALLQAAVQQTGVSTPWRGVCALPFTADRPLRRAWTTALQRAGAKQVQLVPTLVCAALGAHLPAMRPVGSLLVHLGASRVEVGVVSWGGVVHHRAVADAGRSLDGAILAWFRRQHRLLLPRSTAEQLRLAVLQALGRGPTRQAWVTGYDIPSGIQRAVTLEVDEVEALAEPIWSSVATTVLAVVQAAASTVAADLINSGILLTGGLARTPGLEQRIAAATGLPTFRADDPESAVVNGMRALVDSPADLARIVRLFDATHDATAAGAAFVPH